MPAGTAKAYQQDGLLGARRLAGARPIPVVSASASVLYMAGGTSRLDDAGVKC